MTKLDPKVLLVIAALYFGFKHQDMIVNNVPSNWLNKPAQVEVINTKDRVIQPIDVSLQSVVKPITDALKGGGLNNRDKVKDAYFVGDFYGDFAEILVKSKSIATTSQLRKDIIEAGQIAFTKGDISGAYPQLNAAIESVLTSQLGLDAAPLDYDKAIRTLNAMQQAAYNGIQ